MNHKIKSIIDNFDLSLSEDDSRQITSSLGINDLRKNPTSEQEVNLNQVCQLISEGKSINMAVAQVTQSDITEPLSLSDADLEKIITEQANKAADAALLSLPRLAESQISALRETFLQQFKIRIEQQLKSPEYQEAFIKEIESLGELPISNSSTPSIALPSSSSSNS